MLVLLSAPRGRVSAARVVAHGRERERAPRVVVRLPGVRVVPAPAEGHPPAIPSDREG